MAGRNQTGGVYRVLTYDQNTTINNFVYMYYETFDIRRDMLPYLFAESKEGMENYPALNFNGQNYSGIDEIKANLFTIGDTNHELTSVVGLLLNQNEKEYMVTVQGTVTINGGEFMFSESMVLEETDKVRIVSTNCRIY
ncbi:unnamed protein product [Bursaphelenchus okinawaensis]|uniref:NTF2 domain-containing protein n=1 Tax=Bursaphelenchus okinawaensis TaxID=465554 RepID=A0A811JRP7_9BILA|nr:unnamed protein product [Bursaphelenchus okinawaensis]CAG9079919.1 unnamed protein product [Bursaphelenchus okinawaensis]